MPWLSRRNSAESDGSPKASLRQNGHQKPTKERSIKFIPAQIDGLCGTSPAQHRQAPSKLLMADLRLLMQNIRSVPAMTRSMCSSKVLHNSLGATAGVRDVLLHICLALTQLQMLIFILPAFILLPGFAFMICLAACWTFISILAWPMKGSRVVTSGEPLMIQDDFSDERWIFVNSAACSHRALQVHCNRLSRTFGRPITGIHNRTNGLVIDAIEVLLQRSFGISTPCTIALISAVRDAVLSNSVRRVILLAHGTGTLPLSHALDTLHANLPIDVISKLEIYTFGGVATHLSNPALRLDSLDNNSNPSSGHSSNNGSFHDKYTRPNGSIASPVKAALGTLGHRIEDRERVIPHIEHYALTSDFLALTGILHSVRNTLDTRFCGRVFVLDDARLSLDSHGRGGGFMFEEHYLDLLFPENRRRSLSLGVASGGEVLDAIVEVDVATAEKREFTAQGVALPLKSMKLDLALPVVSNGVRTPRESPDVSPRGGKRGAASTREKGGDRTGDMGQSGQGGEKRRSWGTAGAMGIDGVGRARMGAKECEGRTVRQLSRLWRFANGGRPVGEGVPVMNGVGANGMGMVQ